MHIIAALFEIVNFCSKSCTALQPLGKVCAKGDCSDEFCPFNQKCTSARTKTCECKNGFARNAVGDCVDFDECATNDHSCPEMSVCENVKGNYVCRCLAGYEGSSCVDIDECTRSVCNETEKCINSFGSYNCDCMEGFEQVKDYCVDIDECALNTTDCSHVCRNTLGSFECLEGVQKLRCLQMRSRIYSTVSSRDYSQMYCSLPRVRALKVSSFHPVMKETPSCYRSELFKRLEQRQSRKSYHSRR